MAAAVSASRATREIVPLGGRLLRLLAQQTPETLAVLEAFLVSRQGRDTGERARSPFNLTIQEVALLSSFRKLPDAASREAAASGIAGFGRFISSSRHAALLGRSDYLSRRLTRAARQG